MRRSTDNLVALQFLAVILPVSLVLFGQLLADAHRATALAESRPLRNLASEARANYRTFINGVADAVDSGTLGRQSADALQASANELARLSHLAPVTELGGTPALVAGLAQGIRAGARLEALTPLRAAILQGDQQTRAIDTTFVNRDQAVVREAIDSARLQKRLLIAALFVSAVLTIYFVLLTRRRLKQQIEADAAVERARRAELETISIRFGAATRAARAGVYELQARSQKVWWSETMNELYGHEGGDFCPTLARLARADPSRGPRSRGPGHDHRIARAPAAAHALPSGSAERLGAPYRIAGRGRGGLRRRRLAPRRHRP